MAAAVRTGGTVSYSSIGFIVLGDIVAKVSGQTFEEYLQEHIVDPVGMKDTLLIVRGDRSGTRRQPACAQHHARGNRHRQISLPRRFAPAGTLYSSITDMARYAADALESRRVRGDADSGTDDLRRHVGADL